MIKEIRDLANNTFKEAYVIPIAISLFLIPLFWCPSFIHSFTQGKELLFKGIMTLTLLSTALVVFHKKEFIFNKVANSPLFLLLLLQMCIFAVTNVLSSTPIIALYGTYSRGFGFIIELFLFIFLTYCSLGLSQNRIDKLLKITFAAAFLVSIYAIGQKFGFDPFFENYNLNIFAGRSFSFLGNPSYLGQFILLQIIIGSYLAYTERKRWHKSLFIIGVILMAIALIFSGTRTALLGLIVALILVLIKFWGKIYELLNKQKKAALLLIAIVVAIATFLPKDRYSLSDTATRSLDSRFEIWKGTIELIAKNPLSGYGDETFYVYFPEIITRKFLKLEENLNISADRIHNETLEIFFSHGIFAVIVYLAILLLLLKIFFKSKNKTKALLALIIIANIIQNQFAFSDISISIIIVFCFGGILSLGAEKITIKAGEWQRPISGLLISLSFFIGYVTVFQPWMSQLAYATSHKNYNINYSIAVNKHKETLEYTPFYSELWYELMIIDPSSMERALSYLEQIEGDSGNVLAWKGNFYSKIDPDIASEFYLKALKKNPYHPNWLIAFADMLYEQRDYENALFLYNKYLDSIPNFWQWKDELDRHSIQEQKSYQAFLKQNPYFWGTIEKMEKIISGEIHSDK